MIQLLQPRPAVAALGKFRTKTKHQLRVVTQVRNTANAEPLRDILAHAQGKVIPETQRLAHHQAQLSQLLPERSQGLRFLGGKISWVSVPVYSA